MKKILVLIVLLGALFGCKTDFEINAPYDRIPIIYGVLDQGVDTQWIKINKSFLGTNNLEYPSVNDSMYFDNVTVKVEEINEDGSIGRVYSLQEKTVNVAQGSGIFFTGSQNVYFFVDSTLDENKEYRIVGDGDGRAFSATTNMIESFDFTNNFRIKTLAPGGISLFNSGVYNDVKPAWRQSPDAESYGVVMRFHYTEHRIGNVYEKFVDWNLGEKKPTTSGELETVSNSESFFGLLANTPELKDTAGVTKRVIGTVDFRITSANFILKTYIDVNKPNSGVAFDKPDYTNIEGGRGVWASRYTSEITGRSLSEKTVEHLYNGSYTSHLKFCSDNPAWSTDPYYCP